MKKIIYLLIISIFVFTNCQQEVEIIDVDQIYFENKENKVDVCHYDADTDTWKTINITENAVKAHLKHGDFLGDCNETRTLIPDNQFEHFLIYEGYDDVIDGSVLTMNIANITELNIPFDHPAACGGLCSDISDITGIEDFISLKELHFGLVFNSSFDFSFAPNLEKLFIREQDYLTSLDISNNTALTHLFIAGAKNLTTLNLNNNSALLELSLTIGAASIVNITSIDLSNNTLITDLTLELVPLSTLDLSNNTAITHLDIIPGLNMISLNLNNGNNLNFTFFNVAEEPNLVCIQVDDAAWSTANWTSYYLYSENCY